MGILHFIFYLGILNILFGFIWKWLFLLPTAALFTLIKFDYGDRLVKIFGTYLLISMTALLTIFTLGEEPSVVSLVLYPLIGGLFIFMTFGNNQYEARKQAYRYGDWEMLQELEQRSGFEARLMVGSIIYYLVALFIPAVAMNILTEWAFKAIAWVYNLPVIGFLVGIVGVLVLIYVVYNGLFVTGYLATTLLRKQKKSMLEGENHTEEQGNEKQ